MRIGDVYKIRGFLKEKRSDKDVIAFFANDYDEDHVKVFLKSVREEQADKAKVEKPAATKSKKKIDPLG